MAYDYSSTNQRLELPNPYRVENAFLCLSAAVLLGVGLAVLALARTALAEESVRGGIVPLVVGIGLIAASTAFAVAGANRLRFFFGRGRPVSLAPEVALGATGNSAAADHYKAMLRQGGIEYPEPHGALNGVLYHLVPRLITAPLVVQDLAQRHFFNALAFLATLVSFVVSWGVFGTAQTRPAIGIAYCAFAAVVLLGPLRSGARVRMTNATLLALVVLAMVGPVLIGLAGSRLPAIGLELHGQTIALLLTALVAVGLALLAVFAQIDGPPQTERSCEQSRLSMNGPPGALYTELDRRLQNEWVEKIPNRRYTRLEPVTEAAAGSGRFAGELFEETQPMPIVGTTAPAFGSAWRVPRHRWLVALDVYATLLIAAAVAFAWHFVKTVGELGWGGHAPVGYALICLVVGAFCFQSAGPIWGRFNFESVLVWVELLGVWQASRIGTGNQLTSRVQTQNDVVRVESMTLRVWRARIESVVFGKDGPRQVTAMFGTAQEARQLAAALTDFAGQQSVFVAPTAGGDRQRLGAIQASEAVLGGKDLVGQGAGAATSHALAGGATPAAVAHEAVRVDQAHAAVGGYCARCGTPVAAGARFCSGCGQPLT